MDRPTLDRARGPPARRPPQRKQAPEAQGSQQQLEVEVGVTREATAARRREIKVKAKEWEQTFEKLEGHRPSMAERRASPRYVHLRRLLMHADAALRIFDEPSGAKDDRVMRLWRETARAGFVRPPPELEQDSIDVRLEARTDDVEAGRAQTLNGSNGHTEGSKRATSGKRVSVGPETVHELSEASYGEESSPNCLARHPAISFVLVTLAAIGVLSGLAKLLLTLATSA